MKAFKFISVAILSSFGLAAYGADTFKIDPVHSSIIFGVKHGGITDFYGAFKQVSGTIAFDAADPSKSSVEVTVPIDSIDTRNDKRDQHLKSPDFFNAAQFPTMTFKSTKVEANGTTYKVTGDLTMHGVTKPVTVEFKKGAETKGQKGEVKTGGETRFTLKRSDYDIKFMPQALGDEVNVIMSLEAAKE
jgi:polyisoprenoid-binding protein YceI